MKEYITTRCEGSSYYEVYREIIDGRGHWSAQKTDCEGKPLGDPFQITYDQGRGLAPIGKPTLAQFLGKRLLPH